ncbi:MAG: glycosyltransferase, partial [Rhodanobacter sp.]
ATAQRVSEALQIQLIEARGEIVKRDARIRTLEQVRDELELIKSSRSWRWMRPLRFMARVIRHRGIGPEDRRKLMRQPAGHAAMGSDEPATAVAPISVEVSVVPLPPHTAVRMVDVELAERPESLRDFFVWAVIDWHFRIQRPQHLARELAAAGHRVFYISNNFIDRREPGFSVESLDSEGRLFQIHLHLQGSPAIYHGAPGESALVQLRNGIGMLLAWTRSRACVSLVQHPYWLETAQILPNRHFVYDCMDHHGGFADNCDDVLAREHELMRDADLLVVTSDWLRDEAGKYNPQCMMLRNACQYEHFAHPPEKIFRDARGRKVIGYYGAIAEWFDLDLLEKVARRFSDCLVLLVGSDTSGAQRRLQALGNVEFTGEVSYASLPYYLEAFDVCLLPFQVIPLTLATNPVKVYEYLSAGKDVVSIELPEIRQFGDLVRTGSDHASFLEAVDKALHAAPDPQLIARRRKFAAEQTWAHRVHDLVKGIDALPRPRVSVVVVTYNNLDLTKACLHSLEQYSSYANLEVIVVDNASADDTPAYLRAWTDAGSDRKLVLNDDNRGFAAANNQGLALATGDYLVMLNNDTYVTPGWVATLVAHLRRSKKLGMLGPVTNNIGNEARIDIRYDSMDEMLQLAADYTRRHAGQLTPLRTAAFFCVMMSRQVYEKVGPLDEAFGIGFFEDDDYCRRVEQAGWTIACADDVFVHHNLSASFNKLKQETRQALFEANKVTYEAKWGAWAPHKYREG